MTLATRESIIEFVVKTRLEDTSRGTNHSVYDKRLTSDDPWPKFKEVPRCIYFYYVRIDGDGKVAVDFYNYVERDSQGKAKPIEYVYVPAIVRKLALNGRPSTPQKDPPKGPSHNFDPLPWVSKSYIAIFFDEANWRFHRIADGNAAIVFNPDLGLPNHTFFDAQDLLLTLPKRGGGTDERSAIFFVNHMKRDANGDDLKDGDVQEFKFDMWLTATFVHGGGTGMSVNFDPGGTNDGPPQDP